MAILIQQDVSLAEQNRIKEDVEKIKTSTENLLDFYTKIQDIQKDIDYNDLTRFLLGIFENVVKGFYDLELKQQLSKENAKCTRYLYLEQIQITRIFSSQFCGLRIIIPSLLVKEKNELLTSNRDEVVVMLDYLDGCFTLKSITSMLDSSSVVNWDIPNIPELSEDYAKIRDSFFTLHIDRQKLFINNTHQHVTEEL